MKSTVFKLQHLIVALGFTMLAGSVAAQTPGAAAVKEAAAADAAAETAKIAEAAKAAAEKKLADEQILKKLEARAKEQLEIAKTATRLVYPVTKNRFCYCFMKLV